LVYAEWNKDSVKIKDDKYIITNHWNWDSCYWWGEVKLLDKNLNLLNKINNFSSGCDISISNYSIDWIDFWFYNKMSEYKEWTSEIIKKYPISYKILEKTDKKIDKHSFIYNLKEYKITSENNFKFDVEKNLFSSYKNWTVNFNIWNKNYKYNISEIKNKKNIENNFKDDILLSANKQWNIYKLEWSFLYKYENKISKVEILSCSNNWNIYDKEYYRLKSFKSFYKEFNYNISSSYWNLCDIPYIIKITDENWNIIKQKISLEK
jgi:hypothetical protein